MGPQLLGSEEEEEEEEVVEPPIFFFYSSVPNDSSGRLCCLGEREGNKTQQRRGPFFSFLSVPSLLLLPELSTISYRIT